MSIRAGDYYVRRYYRTQGAGLHGWHGVVVYEGPDEQAAWAAYDAIPRKGTLRAELLRWRGIGKAPERIASVRNK